MVIKKKKTTKKKMGRPRKPKTPNKVDTEKVGGVLALVELGYTTEKALELTGVPDSTFYDLLKRYPSFSEEYKRVFNYGNKLSRQAILESIKEKKIIEKERDPNTGEYIEIEKVIPPNLNSAKWWLEHMERDEVYSLTSVVNETPSEVNSRRAKIKQDLLKWRQVTKTSYNDSNKNKIDEKE